MNFKVFFNSQILCVCPSSEEGGQLDPLRELWRMPPWVYKDVFQRVESTNLLSSQGLPGVKASERKRRRKKHNALFPKGKLGHSVAK